MGRIVDENYFPVEEYNEPKIVTNYDRIMAMSVDELAKFIMHIEKDIFNQTIIDGAILFKDNDFYEWLESEVDTK